MIFPAWVLQPISECWVLLASLIPLLHVRPSSCACCFLGYFLHLFLSPFTHTSNVWPSSGCCFVLFCGGVFFCFFLVFFYKIPRQVMVPSGNLITPILSTYPLQSRFWIVSKNTNLSAFYHGCLQVQEERKHCHALCHQTMLQHMVCWHLSLLLSSVFKAQ